MLKIISGGQTGVDRAALDAAIECNVPSGGWCPEGRKAEDGIIPEIYPLQELVGGGYSQRTRKNILDSDGTVIVYFNQLSGGTELTLRYCLNDKRPYLLIDASEIKPTRAAERMIEFFKSLNGEVINFAGPRASGEPSAYNYAKQAIMVFIEHLSNG